MNGSPARPRTIRPRHDTTIGSGPWTALPGTGKSRKLLGYASGTKLWVRFAAVRRGLQSAWSTPVLVTIP